MTVDLGSDMEIDSIDISTGSGVAGVSLPRTNGAYGSYDDKLWVRLGKNKFLPSATQCLISRMPYNPIR